MSDFEKQEGMKHYYDGTSYYEDNLKRFIDLENPFQRFRISRVLQLYTPLKNESVLDLGCGWGTFCFALAPLCREMTGLDYSRKSIELCQHLLKNTRQQNVAFVCADAQNSGLNSKFYDLITAIDFFEHLYPEVSERVFDECWRLLKEKGRLLIWAPHRGHFLEILKNHNIILKKDKSHVHYKSMNYFLDALERRNFLIKKAYYSESRWPILSKVERSLLKVVPLFRRHILILAEKRSSVVSP